jgi:lysophospholipase L1-like esterase
VTGHADDLRYVALGDSYTIGTSVDAAERWPNQLVEWLASSDAGRLARREGAGLEVVANLGVNSYTSRDVLTRELPRLAPLDPGFVSLLVGVNDVIRGVPEGPYRANVAEILDAAISLVGTGRCLFVTTPDYTVTPAGADYGDPAAVAAAIQRFNAAGRAVAEAQHVAVVDIHDLSLLAAADRSLVARDGLHPSGAQYSRWVDRIGPVVSGLLAARAGMSPSGY